MLEPYEKQLLEKLSALTEENNTILKSLRNHARWAVFFGFIKWTIILTPIVAAYIYLQPYIGNLKGVLEKFPIQFLNSEGLNTNFVDGIGQDFESVKSLFQLTPDDLPDVIPESGRGDLAGKTQKEIAAELKVAELKVAQLKAAQEKAAKEKAAKEKAEKERLEKERLEKERLEKERAAKEAAEKEVKNNNN